MPTKNPRLTITISPTLHAQLRRLSDLTGNSQSALIADLLAGVGPRVQRVIRTLEIAQAAKAAMGGTIGESLGVAQELLEKQLGLELGPGWAESVGDLVERAEEPRRHRRRQAPQALAAAVTPPSNRGVRNPNEKASAQGQARGRSRGGKRS